MVRSAFIQPRQRRQLQSLPELVTERNEQVMKDTEQAIVEVTLDALDETVNELERLMALLAERLGAKPVTHYQDK